MNSPQSDRESDDLRQYLLGLLPQSQREAVDRRILTESEFYEELQATEEDLVDEYLSGTLSQQERQQFEQHFAIGEERPDLVRFGRSWRNYLQTAQIADPQEEVPGSISFWNTLNVRAALVVAVSLIVLVGGIVWLARRQNQQSAPRQVVAVTLNSGALRGPSQSTFRFPQPPPNSTVNVELELATNDYSSYNVELSKENEPVNAFKALQAQPKDGHFIVVVPVESDLLNPGDYTFTLTGAPGTAESNFKGSYHIRIHP